MTNKINFDCECGGKESDVQGKISGNDEKGPITLIQTKCLKCKGHHFLKEDDERCLPFFKNKD